MQRFFIFLLVVFSTSSFLFTSTAEAKVLISQIQTAGTSATDEYVELYNASSLPVSLEGWSLKKQTANGNKSNLVATFPSAIIAPFSYYLIGSHDYAPTDGREADLLYSNSSTSLADNNEALLFDANGTLDDEVDWGGTNQTAAPNTNASQSLARLPNDEQGNRTDTDDSSHDFIVSASAPRNSQSPARPIYSSGSEAATTTTPVVTSTSENVSETTTTTAQTISNDWNAVKINEFMPDPKTGNEWIELFNNSTKVITISGGSLCDNRTITDCAIATLSGTIAPNDWTVITLSGNHLNNDGDSVLLRNDKGIVVDSVTYAGDLVPGEAQTLARIHDGVDTDSTSDWTITMNATPGASNQIVSPPASPSTKNKNANSSQSGGPGGPIIFHPPAPSGTISNVPSIIINELLPDPAGNDLNGEYIELKNISDQNVNLSGWKLADAKKNYNLSGILAPEELLLLPRNETKIVLPNSDAEDLQLLDPSETIASKVTYDRAETNNSYSRADDGSWQWSSLPTPGEENIIVKPDDGSIVWKINIPDSVAPQAQRVYSAEGTADRRGGRLNFLWNFGDGQEATGVSTTHTFATSDAYTITLLATSTEGSRAEKELSVLVAPNNDGAGSVLINEIYANPADASEDEFIEIANAASTSVNVSNWKLETAKGSSFTVPAATTLAPNGLLTFYHTATGLTLNNTSERIDLFTNNGQLVDVVRLGKSLPGQSYAFVNNGWQWVAPSPNVPNGRVDTAVQTAVTATVETSAATKIKTMNSPQTLAAARALPKGTAITLRGIVSAAPDTFVKNTFYLSDTSGGLAVYAPKKNLPLLPLGSSVEVTGKIGTLSNAPRLNLTAVPIILKNSASLSAQPLDLEDVQRTLFGRLVTVHGNVAEKGNNYFYLDDGTARGIIGLKSGASLDESKIASGQTLTVTGILEETQTGWEIWPRQQTDITFPQKKKVATSTPSSFNRMLTNFGLAVANAITNFLRAI